MNRVMPLPNATTLEEYVVTCLLGQGGFGTTYLCVDRNLGRKCVIKEYSPYHLAERRKNGKLEAKAWRLQGVFEKGLKSFLDEARTLARFNHPNIVRINRYFQANGTGYFVMDYESGISLRNILSQEGDQFEEQEIEAIVVPLCEGLSQLHRQGLIHRDIKPDNIIIRLDGSPILIDFGAALDLDALRTGAWDVLATPSYAPIEQYDPSLPQGPWTDIYALAATLYELISGHPPPQAFRRITDDALVPAKEIGRGKYSDRLLGLIDKSLATNPLERPQGVSEFLSLFCIDNNGYLRGIIGGLSEKTIQHFINWAKPNPGLFVDEFVAFAVCFPIIDLSWRLGKGAPTKDLFLSLFRTLDYDILKRCHSSLIEAGFTSHKRNLTLKTLEARIDEYAATYLLDRQAEEWRYEHTRRQCSKNCLSSAYDKDIQGFEGLLEDVIDRARGRVKKEFEKAFRKVLWISTPDGWRKEIRSFSSTTTEG